ncbi:uncharacterized protein LOC103702772 [Phoenix dactylifera]|uniref:Uncharacterized protein LOC103702772 n=1 Tax=Phoenix dactylifera TaxID=42345 RepID=A0A8B7BQZ5_PHODC|nr:uncharacterized protein LOC103702772 [Phoenix dactylifera]
MELVFAVPQPHHHQPNGAVTGPNETPTPLTDLASALNQAAKVLSTSSDAAAAASLRNAHQLIGSFLAQLDSRLPAGDEDEPMFDRREGEEEGDGGDGSRIIDEMEEGVRELVLPSKRRKRQVSPSWSLGRDADQGEELSSVHPMDRRRSSMDLVFQFHA